MASELPTILTMLGIGLALGGFIFALYRLQQREMDQRFAALTQQMNQGFAEVHRRIDGTNHRVDGLETQGRAMTQDIAEVKGALGVIRDAIPLRVGEPPA